MARKSCEAIALSTRRRCQNWGKWFIRVAYSSRPMVVCEKCAPTYGEPGWRRTAQPIW